jgi:hypothetical protein
VISRRELFGVTAGLTSVRCLRGKYAQQPVSPVKADNVVVSVVVTDGYARYVNGLKPSDFRVFEDDILQKISTFAEGSKPPLLLNDDGTTKPPVNPKSADEAGKAGTDPPARKSDELENSYTITYSPDPSNHNEGFRTIKIEIATDVYKRWRVRARPGYRPKKRIPVMEGR